MPAWLEEHLIGHAHSPTVTALPPSLAGHCFHVNPNLDRQVRILLIYKPAHARVAVRGRVGRVLTDSRV